MKYLLLLCLLTGFISLSTALEGPLVHTKLGALRGEYLRVRGKTTVIHSYLGVPFAKPPVGALRLAPPQPVQGWEGVRDATKQPFMCIQDRQISIDALEVFSMISEIPEVSEDCLYLNIYTPVKPAEDAKLPVMVWIHGGGFFMGSASSYDGSVLAAYQNVVVVLIQYRLGMLGFLSTGDDNAPGNMGLLDQVAALQWVQENIQSFGGDPSSVTIFGESAGGVSVSLQMLSPLSSGLFHRAIAQSGTAAMDLLVTTDSSGVAMVTTIFAISWLLPMPPNTPPPQLYQMMANASGCAGTKPHEIVDCVMKMSTEDVIEIAKRLDILFMVCVDGHFLPKPVDDLIKSHKFSKVPLINGINSDEGGYGLTEFMAPPDWKEGMDADAVKQSIMPLLFQFGDSEVIDFIVEGYLGDGKDRVKNRDAFRDLCADVMFNMPGIKLSNAHRDSGASVYMYELQHPPSILSSKRPSFVKVDHGDDIIFVFGGCFFKAHIKMNGSLTEEEDELCRTIMSYWGNFARTGFPNGPGLTHWPMYGSGEEYLGIGLKQQVGTHLKAERFTFMTETLPKKIQEIQQQQEQKHEMQQQQQQQKQEMQQQQQRHSDEL